MRSGRLPRMKSHHEECVLWLSFPNINHPQWHQFLCKLNYFAYSNVRFWSAVIRVVGFLSVLCEHEKIFWKKLHKPFRIQQLAFVIRTTSCKRLDNVVHSHFQLGPRIKWDAIGENPRDVCWLSSSQQLGSFANSSEWSWFMIHKQLHVFIKINFNEPWDSNNWRRIWSLRAVVHL